MTEPRTVQDRFAAQLEAFRFREDVPERRRLDDLLRDLHAALPPVPADAARAEPEALHACLAQRAEAAIAGLAPLHAREEEALALAGLHTAHSFEVLFGRTRLLDALHRFAFAVALEEFPAVLRLRGLEAEGELSAKREALPRRRERLDALERDLADESRIEDPAQRDYLRRIADEQRTELEAQERIVAALTAAGPALAALASATDPPEQRLVLFARGGYGRAELSFSSDVDTGYALQPDTLSPAQVEVFHEVVRRVELLLREVGVETAHQFFELGEDLSRFTEAEALHTVPSILESRAVAGNPTLLEALQAQFRAILPFERLVRQKIEEYESEPEPNYTAMDLKEERGGLRSIQVPLWLLGVTYESRAFMTVDLLRLALDKGLLSPWEAARLLLALEFLNDLRNFGGAAQRYYYDREARESGFHVQAFQPNRLDDQLARLYLFRRQRFPSIDAFDTYRLRRVDEVQRISRRLLTQVLNRTASQELGPFHVSVHLGQRRIINLRDAQGRPVLDVAALFPDSEALLTLFAFMATTGYELAEPLQEAMAGAVTTLRVPETGAALARQAEQLGTLMAGPFAHRALEALFAISDPLTPGQPTLIGRFLPEFDEAVFLLRRFEGSTLPLHAHVLRSLAGGQAELAALRRHNPELHGLLRAEDVLAFKWSLLLYGLGRLGGGVERPAHTAERAADVLARLGYANAGLERRVRLLIEHHASVAALARTSTYMDQALARLFEIAGRDLVNVTLLYLVNLAVLQAQGPATEVDETALRALFSEANEMLGQMRGFPVQERSLELINLYFDRKKHDLVADTRLHLLLHNVIARGVRPAVLAPLAQAQHPALERVQGAAEELETLQRRIVLGARGPREQARISERLLQTLRAKLGREAVLALTAEHDPLLSWFFSAFPNRYLMGALPADLAAQMAKFAQFREATVIVDVVSGLHGASEGLLIYINGLSRPHTRVSYAMSRNRVNIGSGKVNCIEVTPGRCAYCYYFQISLVDSEARLTARDLEMMLASDTPPELGFPERSTRYARTGVRVEFRGDDAKGYRIVPRDGHFDREEAPYPHLQITLRDEPYLLYKVARAFDLFDVEVRQALITTIGNQVVDYFYLTPDDYERLRTSRFEEVLVSLMHSDLLAVAR